MSITWLRKSMHGWFRWVFLSLAVVIALGMVMYFGGGPTGEGKQQNAAGGGKVMAKVGSSKLDRAYFEERYQQELETIAPQLGIDGRGDASRVENRLPPLFVAQMRGRAFDQILTEMAIVEAAQKDGIKVGWMEKRKEVSKETDRRLNMHKDQLLGNSKDKSNKAFQQALKRYMPGTTIDMLKTQIRQSINEEELRSRLVMEKLSAKLRQDMDSSDEAVRRSFDEVKFSRITVSTEKRSKEQAQARADEIVVKVRGGADFATVAKENSDDFLKMSGGSAGIAMPISAVTEPGFAEALAKMKPGDVSDPFESPGGLVILKLDSRESKLPKDYTDPKKQKQYKDSYVMMAAGRAQQAYVEKAKKEVKVEILDPEMKALRMLQEAGMGGDMKAVYLGAIDEYKKAAKSAGNDSRSVARIISQEAYLYQALGSPGMPGVTEEERAKYRVEQKQALINALNYTESAELRMMLATIRIEDKEYEQAADDLTYVAANLPDDPGAHEALLGKYEDLKAGGYSGADKLIAEERKTLEQVKERQKQQEAAMRAMQEAQANGQKQDTKKNP